MTRGPFRELSNTPWSVLDLQPIFCGFDADFRRNWHAVSLYRVQAAAAPLLFAQTTCKPLFMSYANIICIGSVLWDIIGTTDRTVALGADVPGRITRRPGGVALNIALCLQTQALNVQLISAVGTDAVGDELLAELRKIGLGCDHIIQQAHLPTDRYMAIESNGALVAAIADAHSLEAAGDKILAPLRDGRLGQADTAYDGVVVVDGNLLPDVLTQIATGPEFHNAQLRVVPASPGKADRQLALRAHPNATFYFNRIEAELILGQACADAASAAEKLLDLGYSRAVVTDGPAPCADATRERTLCATPPKVEIRQVTGAGDSFIAGHIAAEYLNKGPQAALEHALSTAAAHISETPS